MTEEKLVHLMGEARLISASENVLFPMIDLKIQQQIDLMCGKFANGDTEFVGQVAYVAALKEIRRDLENKMKAGNKAIQTLHEREENKN